jgi:hypothetical protein
MQGYAYGPGFEDGRESDVPRDWHAGVRTPHQPPLSQAVARFTHLLYRLRKHLLY